MSLEIVNLKHESTHAAAPRSDASSSIEFSRGNSWRLDWDKDRGPTVASGGATVGMDNRCSRTDSNELESLGSICKSKWSRSVERTAAARKACAVEQDGSKKFGGPSGENTDGLWFITGSLGWPDVGRSFEEKVWDRFNGAPCPALDAPIGLSDEAGQSCVPSSSFRRCEEVPSSDKKNSKRWGRVKPLFSRMKVDLPFIRKWGGVGPRLDNA